MTIPSTCRFNPDHPLEWLPPTTMINICDVHVHVWEKTSKIATYVKIATEFGIKHTLSIDSPLIKDFLDHFHPDFFSHAYYLSSRAFAHQKIKILLNEIQEAQRYDYTIYKMWFGPRFLDHADANGPFHIDDDKFTPVFQELEKNDSIVLIHIADPDIWYRTKYLNHDRYGTKEEVYMEFREILQRHPDLTIIGCHFGGFPEHLDKLDQLLENFPNLFLDTASTRWMIRELGKNKEKTKDFFSRHARRILFGIDLSIHKNTTQKYLYTRHWSQRLFWETEFTAPLPFYDDDTNGNTIIRGLNLPTTILKKMYWENARKLLKF